MGGVAFVVAGLCEAGTRAIGRGSRAGVTDPGYNGAIHYPITASDSRAASMVWSMSESAWAAETKAASNWLHGR